MGELADRPLLEGVLPPLVTPFKADGTLDLGAFEVNLESYSRQDLAGYLVLGSNGEAATLDESEKLALVRATRRRTASRIVLAGCGLESTRATTEFVHKAAAEGADAALVLTPHYYKALMSLDVLRRHFETVADAAPIPVLAYSVPQFTGVPWPLELTSLLAGHARIRGMKESSGDVGLLGRIAAAVPASFALACGSAPVFYPALCLGASAGILAVACCTPGVMAALYRAFQAGDHPRARALQAAIAPLAAAVTSGHGVPGLKAAMDAAGLRGGFPRAPLLPVGAAARRRIQDLLADVTARTEALISPSR